ncbi:MULTISPECIES: hypothetical protein [Enterobacterales]|uniref:hypothetical protein n=1 Tax=Enterobacterales TaxID=91347 RepID=UPI000848134F|nr:MULTISPECIES: hypothetical protein [Enterobacterales]MCI9727722.1 hypothetical protein [Proteus mirabilis]MCI9731479.1 hypothetical protein [Proteus mirabilis]MCI9735234.1 hypothetical protein [Proteus mirabilis]MCI9756025.1 hypothetical protein [Proteus mirabilis]MCI9759783.1 hypothetical protein [Proteus mirabilis]
MKTSRLLLIMIIAFIIGFVLTKIVIGYIDLNNNITPWILVTLFIFPSSFCVQAMLKLPESNEHIQLSSSELRRLKGIVRSKQLKLCLLVFFYIISAVIIVTMFLMKNLNLYFGSIISICFGLIFSSLSTLLYIKSIMDEIQSFKSLMLHRDNKAKKKNELINNLTNTNKE